MPVQRNLAIVIAIAALFPSAILAQSAGPAASGGGAVHGSSQSMSGHAMQGSAMHNPKMKQSHMKNGQAMKSGHMMAHPAPKST